VAQITERPLTGRTLVRPLVLMEVAVATYLRGFPTAGHDVLLAGVLGMGARFGFIVWITHGGAGWHERFSSHHGITSVEA
jgi:hypothetical protein